MEPESKETSWVVQKVVAEDPGAMVVEWDTFNIGVVEGDTFRAIYTCWSQPDADFLLSALRWYTSFKEGRIPGVEAEKAVPAKTRKKGVSNGR
jgi:hypothetical protein